MALAVAGRPVPVVGRARVYVCGITPYDTTHVGHAATFIWSDVAARVLRHTGVEVDVCRNITDIDDDMMEQARRQGIDWRTLGNEQAFRFEEDMRRLRVTKPTYEPYTRNFIDEVVELAGALLEREAAYERDGSVFFKGETVYERAGIDRDEALAIAAERGGRPDDPKKDNPLDVPVWQSAEPDEPSWPSPWGPGRPGWHAECTAMCLTLLGTSIDLHSGGEDLRFPHHAYEAAQAEAVTGVAPFARSWMHVGMVRLGGEKMAKSTGNLVFVHDLLEKWPPEALRLLILDRPWGEPWDFEEGDLALATDRVDRLWSQAGRRRHDEAAEERAIRALLDDLDAGYALELAQEAGGHTARTVGTLLGI